MFNIAYAIPHTCCRKHVPALLCKEKVTWLMQLMQSMLLWPLVWTTVSAVCQTRSNTCCCMSGVSETERETGTQKEP